MSITITDILYKDYFWCGIWLVLGVLIYFAKRRSSPPFPRVNEFFARHKKGIIRILDVLLICLVLLWSLFPLSFVGEIYTALSAPEPIRFISLRVAFKLFFLFLIIWSGISGFFVGLLSVFHFNLTRTKRTILLIVCLLPLIFTALQIGMDITESPWIAIQICFYYSLGSWIINTPTVLLGKHFSQVLEGILGKLKSA